MSDVAAGERELSSHGITFGSHTVNHTRLYALRWPEIRDELAQSKAVLEQEVQMSTRCFAYPYAFPQEDSDFVRRLRHELAELNYAVAVTTMIGRATVADDPLCTRRVPVNDCDDEGLFAAKLNGAYDWLAVLQKAHRNTARLVRSVRTLGTRKLYR